MTPDLKTLGIDQMSVEDRVALLYAIGRTIPPGSLTDAQQAELDRRLDQIDAGTAQMIPFEQVKAELDAEFGE